MVHDWCTIQQALTLIGAAALPSFPGDVEGTPRRRMKRKSSCPISDEEHLDSSSGSSGGGGKLLAGAFLSQCMKRSRQIFSGAVKDMSRNIADADVATPSLFCLEHREQWLLC